MPLTEQRRWGWGGEGLVVCIRHVTLLGTSDLPLDNIITPSRPVQPIRSRTQFGFVRSPSRKCHGNETVETLRTKPVTASLLATDPQFFAVALLCWSESCSGNFRGQSLPIRRRQHARTLRLNVAAMSCQLHVAGSAKSHAVADRTPKSPRDRWHRIHRQS